MLRTALWLPDMNWNWIVEPTLAVTSVGANTKSLLSLPTLTTKVFAPVEDILGGFPLGASASMWSYSTDAPQCVPLVGSAACCLFHVRSSEMKLKLGEEKAAASLRDTPGRKMVVDCGEAGFVALYSDTPPQTGRWLKLERFGVSP